MTHANLKSIVPLSLRGRTATLSRQPDWPTLYGLRGLRTIVQLHKGYLRVFLYTCMQFKIHRLKTTPGTDGDSDPVRQRLKSSGAPAQFLTVDVIVREFLNFSLYRGPMPRREKESLLFQFRVNSECGSNELIVLPANNSTSVRQVTRRHLDLRSLIFPSQSWIPLYFNPPKNLSLIHI